MEDYRYLNQAFATCARCGIVGRSAAMYYNMRDGSAFEDDGTPRNVDGICEDCLIESLLLFGEVKALSDATDAPKGEEEAPK